MEGAILAAALAVQVCPAGAGPSLWHRDYWIAKGTQLTERSIDITLQVAAIFAVYTLLRVTLNRMVNGVTQKLIDREARGGVSSESAGRHKTLAGLIKSIIGYVMFFVFGVLVFKAFGFDIMPFITTAGVIGLAIGFGAQKLVKDVISGFFIIVDNMFVVGDIVTIGTTTGEVLEMGMRVTRMQDSSGRVITISNGDIGTVTNLSRNPVEDYIEVAVGPAFEMKKLVGVISSAGETLMKAEDHNLKVAPRLIGVTAFTATSVTLRISVVADPQTVALEQMRVREAVRVALGSAGIAAA
jgi:small-conductance mechanosensitive channel